MRYSRAPALDPRSGMYRGKGDGSRGKKIPKTGAVKTVGHYEALGEAPGPHTRKANGATENGGRTANGDPRKKPR